MYGHKRSTNKNHNQHLPLDRFLASHGAKEAYLTELRKDLGVSRPPICGAVIGVSFSWIDSPQGEDYWWELNNLWGAKWEAQGGSYYYAGLFD